MNNVDPLDWLSQTLTRIARGWPVSELEALFPWNFKPDAIGKLLTIDLFLPRPSQRAVLVADAKDRAFSIERLRLH